MKGKTIVLTMWDYVTVQLALILAHVVIAVGLESPVVRGIFFVLAIMHGIILGVNYAFYKRAPDRFTEKGRAFIHTANRIKQSNDIEEKAGLFACWWKLYDVGREETVRRLAQPGMEGLAEFYRACAHRTGQGDFMDAVQRFYEKGGES